jgi:DNA polymerase-3 subunit gamma/tau
MALVRLARRPPLVPLDELLRRLAELERTLAGGAPGGSSGAAPKGAASTQGGASPRGSSPRSAFGAAPRSALGAAPRSALGAEGAEAQPAEAQPAEAQPAEAQPAEAQPAEAPRMEARELPAETEHASDWDAILAALRARKPPVASVYEHAAPLVVGPGRLHLAFEPGSFLSGQAADSKALVAEVASAHFGVNTVVELDETGRHQEAETVAARNSAELSARRAEARRRVEEHPLVRAAVDVLGAQLREVRLPGEAS